MLTSILPSQVIEILVSPNDKVKEGDPLVILSSMKMENTLCADQNGVVEEHVEFLNVSSVGHRRLDIEIILDRKMRNEIIGKLAEVVDLGHCVLVCSTSSLSPGPGITSNMR